MILRINQATIIKYLTHTTPPMQTHPPVLSVTQLNRQIRSWLENEIGYLYVEGEVSTLSKPASGHYYFTLKDSGAQVRCVFFRNRHTAQTAEILTTGEKIIVYGQLSLYEARGDYQLIVDHVESTGQGDLFLQFEALKKQLAAKGLFDASRKKSIPLYPETIGIITSSSAAALQDILTTLERRYPIAKIIIYPSEVQGTQAPQQLIKALQQANLDKHCDVLILARGGGSIEDLWAFNNEQLAYEIANSSIPIVSGVGHETDITIADFVADLRAATPTAAAEAVSPNQFEILALLENLNTRLKNAIIRLVQHQRLLLQHELQKLSSPGQLIRSYWQTLDYLQNHLILALKKQLADKQHQCQLLTTKLNAIHPLVRINTTQQHIQYLQTRLIQLINQRFQEKKQQFITQCATLHAFSPLATLDRGYAIATHNHHVLSNSQQVAPGDKIQVRLSQGILNCEVLEHAQ